MTVAFAFPNPITWVVDRVGSFVGGVATDSFKLLIGGLTAWVLDAVVWIVGGVFHFFLDATDPNVQADWFVGRNGPYVATATIAATLLVLFVFVGIIQAVLAGDVAALGRQMMLSLPTSVLAMVALVSVTQLAVAVTDALSRSILLRFESDVHAFERSVGTLSALGGPSASAFVIFVLGLATVLAGLVLVAELVIRSALIYIVVALAPLVFAVQVWPAMRGASRRLLELLAALIVSKLVIAVGLAVAAAAVVGVGSGAEVTALRPPEMAAAEAGGSVTHAAGLLLAAVAAFGVSAFSPLLLTKLVPFTEAAMVAHGLRGGPMRAGQSAMSMSSYGRSIGVGRRVATGPVAGPAAATGAGAGVAAAGAANSITNRSVNGMSDAPGRRVEGSDGH